MNQIEFNYETFLKGKHKLVTRGGIKVPREAVGIQNPISGEYKFKYNHPNSGLWYITNNGKIFSYDKTSNNDLFMIPIQTDETIPFDLEKFKSGEYTVEWHKGDEEVLFSTWDKEDERLLIFWKINGLVSYDIREARNGIVMRKKPISPFTHPHLYEVSGDNQEWYPIKKYYDNLEGNDCPHKVLMGNNMTDGFGFLRLKQPTEISKDQAFDALWNKLEVPIMQQVLTEKFGEFKIKTKN
jgi:hypothetical protein